MECNKFYLELADFTPYPHQEEVWDRIQNDKLLTFLRASVGSGKTEGILFPSLAMKKRLFLVYPTRSLVEDQIFRIIGGREKKSYLQKLSKKEEKEFSAIVDIGYESRRYMIDDYTIRVFDGNKVYRLENGKYLKERKLKFPYRQFYDADIILTTFDKFMYRFFGFGKRRWNYLYPMRIKPHLRKTVIAFDEAHVYDSVAFTNFKNLVDALVSHGVQTVVMSATIPDVLLDETFRYFQWDAFGNRRDSLVYGFVKGGERKIKWRDIENEEFVKTAIELIRQNSKKRKIIIANSVRDAFMIYQGLHEFDEDYIYFYHGRMFSDVRTNTYHELKKKDENRENYTLITTHAIEVGCDLSADFMITEFCNPDQLIQRLGRVARKEGKGEIMILGNKIKRHLRTDMIDYDSYRQRLKEFGEYSEEFTRNITSSFINPPIVDIRTSMLFDSLYSFAYEGAIEQLPLYESGFVITRSWEPTATLCFVDDVERVDPEYWKKYSRISVNISSLSISNKRLEDIKKKINDKKLSPPFIFTKEDVRKLKASDLSIYITDGRNYFTFRDINNISLYTYELLIFINRSNFNSLDEIGLVNLPIIFLRDALKLGKKVKIRLSKSKTKNFAWYLQG